MIWIFAFFGSLVQVAFEVGYRYLETSHFVDARTLGYLFRWGSLIVIIGCALAGIQRWGEKQ